MRTFASIVFIVSLFVVGILYGSSQIVDPFGATTRVEIEQRQETERTRIAAEHSTIQADIWASTMPISIGMIVIGVTIWIIAWYRGRAHLIQVERGLYYTSRSNMIVPANSDYIQPPDKVALLAMHLGATERLINGQWALYRKGDLIGWAMPVNGQWALVDNKRQVMAVLEDKRNGSY